MNVKLKVLSAAVMAGSIGMAGTASAGGGINPGAMVNPAQIITPPAANLTIPERAAFAALEAALQAVESKIYVTQCSALKLDLTAYVNQTGNGFVELSSGGVPQLDLFVVPAGTNQVLGNKFLVRGSGNVGGIKVQNFVALYDFDAAGGVMSQSNYHAPFQEASGNGGFDKIAVKVIKDFYRWDPKATETLIKNKNLPGVTTATAPRFDPSQPVFLDWGLQSLAKSGYTQTKYFQWSLSTRSDDDAHTIMWKKRIYDAYALSPCTIKIHTSGQNDGEGFYETGTLKVRGIKDEMAL